MAASQADIIAEFGADNLHPAAGRTKGGGCDLGPSRTEKPLSLAVRDRTADDDPGGI